MNPRTTLVLAVLVAALGSFVYFYEIEGREARDEAEAKTKTIFPDLSADDVDWIELETVLDGRARLERDPDGGWNLTEPFVFPADDVAVRGIIDALPRLKHEVLLEEPGALEDFGFESDEPRMRFGVGDEVLSLDVGDVAPVGDVTYVRRSGTDSVYAVQAFEVAPFRKELSALRDRGVVDFDRNSVRALAVDLADGSIRVEKRDDRFRVVDPVEDDADQAGVEDVLSQLEFLRAAEFVDDPTEEEWASIEDPKFRAHIEIPDRDTLVVEIGETYKPDRRLVRVSGRDTLFAVPAGTLEDLPARPVELRFRDVGDFSSVDAQRFELMLRDEAGQETLQVTGERTLGRWETQPPMQDGAASRMIAELSGLKARDIAAESAGPEELDGLALEPPRIAIRVESAEGDDGKREILADVRLGLAQPERGIAARREGRDTVYWLDYDVGEKIPLSAEAFRNRFLADAEDDAADDEGDAAGSADDEGEATTGSASAADATDGEAHR